MAVFIRHATASAMSNTLQMAAASKQLAAIWHTLV